MIKSEVISMEEVDQQKMRNMLLTSLYEYHYANNGAGYTLPKAMVQTDENSKFAIEYLVDHGYATDHGEGTENLVLAITPKGIDYINNK